MEIVSKLSCLSLFFVLKYILGFDYVVVLLWKRREKERERELGVREVIGDFELKVGIFVF